jgi:hypothetical protein
MLAPIVLFAYKRPLHLQKTLESLLQNPEAAESSLFVFADGAKSIQDQAPVAAVRTYLEQIKGFKEVHLHFSEQNQGLAQSVIRGVSLVLQKYESAIVLEDDLLFSKDFLQFMNAALRAYQGHRHIFSISGYLYPINLPASFSDDVLLLPRASSWGWATWRNRWEQADWQVQDFAALCQNRPAQKAFQAGGEDLWAMLCKQQKGLISSWAVRWSYAHFRREAYCLFPKYSKVQNIGTDSSGTHLPNTQKYNTVLSDKPLQLSAKPLLLPDAVQALQNFFRLSPWRRLLNFVKYGIR